MKKRYEVIGVPLEPPAAVAGRKIGDKFEADLDKDTEQQLVDSNVLKALPEPKAKAAKKSPTSKKGKR